MKIKWLPQEDDNLRDTVTIVDNNTININGENFSFDTSAVQYPDVLTQSEGKIVQACRVDDVLYLSVIRHWIWGDDIAVWDTGEYCDNGGLV